MASALFWMVSVAASRTAARSPLPPITDSPIAQGPSWEGAVGLPFDGVYANMIAALLPVAIICVISLLGTAVWLLAAGAHLRSRGSQAA